MSARTSLSLIEAAIRRVPRHDLPVLAQFLVALGQPGGVTASALYLGLLHRDDVSSALKTAAGLVQHRVRHAPSRLRAAAATHAGDELSQLSAVVRNCMRAPAELTRPALRAPGAVDRRAPTMPEVSDGVFVQLAHEFVQGRGCLATELVQWREKLARGEVTREELLVILLRQAVQLAEAEANGRTADEPLFHVMGSGVPVTQSDWEARALQLPAPSSAPSAALPELRLQSPPQVRVSIITSLYRGGAFIERFMENIVGQRHFASHAELIIVDADSPDGERELIQDYQRRYPNIKYLPVNHRIGIYDAWNIAVTAAVGDYVTSANVDDLRRVDSIEHQAALLDRLDFVDVVYQDFFYTVEPPSSFERAAAFGFRSELPLVTPQNLMSVNSPHNAPMWRRRLHDELGLFDTHLESAGDYEFWMRCLIAGKTFYKLNDPHVVYYFNPQGLSTRPGSRGHEETRQVHRRYGRQLVSENLAMPREAYVARLGWLRATAPGAAANDRLALSYQALQAVAAAARSGALP